LAYGGHLRVVALGRREQLDHFVCDLPRERGLLVVLTVWVLTLARRMAKHLRSGGEKAALIANLETRSTSRRYAGSLNARIGRQRGVGKIRSRRARQRAGCAGGSLATP